MLIATGVRNRKLTAPGANLPGVYNLRTAADGEVLKAGKEVGRMDVPVGVPGDGDIRSGSIGNDKAVAIGGRVGAKAGRNGGVAASEIAEANVAAATNATVKAVGAAAARGKK